MLFAVHRRNCGCLLGIPIDTVLRFELQFIFSAKSFIHSLEMDSRRHVERHLNPEFFR